MFRRPVHIAGFAQLPHSLIDNRMDEAEMVRTVTAAALADAGLSRADVGFICSGSCDYAMGRPFSFTMAIDGVQAHPFVRESHVESDGAWAMYEAAVRLQHGDVDVALVYSYGKATHGDMETAETMQLDPYSDALLQPPPDALAALQAQAAIAAGALSEAALDDVVGRAREAAERNPLVPGFDGARRADSPWVARPLRQADCPRRTDGAAAMVLTVAPQGARIRGLQHRIDPMGLGHRDLVDVRSARLAAEAAGGCADAEVAELHAPWSPQEVLVARALGLGAATAVNPSGGALVAHTPMVSGLVRLGHAAQAVRQGAACAVGTASAGPCLQHNLVCVLEAV